MDNQKNVSSMDDTLRFVLEAGEKIVADSNENLRFGWYDLNIGDKVYFKTYDDINDILTVSKGEIIEIVITEKKVPDKPDDNMESDGWHCERRIYYKVRWNGMTANIDPRYVYTNKTDAVLAAVSGTIKSYFSL